MGKKALIGGLIVAGAAAVVAALWPDAPPPQADASRPDGQRSAPAATDSGRLAELPAREPIEEARGDAFGPRSWAPPPRASKPASAAAPSAPPMPYRVAGTVTHGREAHVVLARNDAVFIVREGEMLEGGYRVEKIGGDQVTLVYLPLHLRQSLAVVSTVGADIVPGPAASASGLSAAPDAVADARPAKIRWDGPTRVREGSDFDVALKVTSAQAVRASPLQLSYDAKLLTPVAVRPGAYFAGGNFSYRVSPDGAILVGVTGQGGVAADAEFVVVTFKPIRSGATAELKLSAAILRGDAGRAIAYDQPGAFRTLIVQ